MLENKKIIIGLTGSIGMGKSTVARMFRKKGASLFDADECVRELLATHKKVSRYFEVNNPEVFFHGKISRKRVGRLIFSSSAQRKKIENFLHPLVKKEAKQFIRQAKTCIIVLEVPLLFETGFDVLCDYTFCVSACFAQQKERFMKRGRMTDDQYKAILKRQYSDRTKRKRADFVIDTSVTQKETRKAVEDIYKEILENA